MCIIIERNDIDTILDGIAKDLSNEEKEREEAIALSRKAIRLSKNIIHAIHTDDVYDDAREELRTLMTALSGKNRTFAKDAMMEYAEAEILISAVSGVRTPTPDELGIDGGSWLMGMADTIGELRRIVLTRLMESDVDTAKELFSAMEVMCEGLMMFDVPDAILPIRRKQDIARGVVERTRSDLLNAKMSYGTPERDEAA
ncbi:MAG: RNA-binding protein [Candidatus Methanomethylophilaceae archaeon]